MDLSRSGIIRSGLSDLVESPKMSRMIDIRASSLASRTGVAFERIDGTGVGTSTSVSTEVGFSASASAS